jgi:hypothetical protein
MRNGPDSAELRHEIGSSANRTELLIGKTSSGHKQNCSNKLIDVTRLSFKQSSEAKPQTIEIES